MQLSEKFRRGVAVALDVAAKKAMEREDVSDIIDVHFLEIVDQAEFETLWKSGFFAEVNASTGSMIDDYEEAVIPAEMVPRVRQIAQAYAWKRAGGGTGLRFFKALVEACDIAESCTSPMYFIL